MSDNRPPGMGGPNPNWRPPSRQPQPLQPPRVPGTPAPPPRSPTVVPALPTFNTPFRGGVRPTAVAYGQRSAYSPFNPASYTPPLGPPTPMAPPQTPIQRPHYAPFTTPFKKTPATQTAQSLANLNVSGSPDLDDNDIGASLRAARNRPSQQITYQVRYTAYNNPPSAPSAFKPADFDQNPGNYRVFVDGVEQSVGSNSLFLSRNVPAIVAASSTPTSRNGSGPGQQQQASQPASRNVSGTSAQSSSRNVSSGERQQRSQPASRNVSGAGPQQKQQPRRGAELPQDPIKGIPERGWPCTISRDWNPVEEARQYGAIQVRVDQLGVIFSEPKGPGTNYYDVQLIHENKRGLVHKSALYIHRYQKYGHITIRHDFPLGSGAKIDTTLSNKKDLDLADQVRIGLVMTMRANLKRLPFLRPGAVPILENKQKRDNFIEKMTNLHPKVRSAYNNPGATLKDITDYVKKVNNQERRRGTYRRVTSKFKSDKNRKPEVYTGSTQDGYWPRLGGHRNPHKSDQSRAAQSVRDANDCEMYPNTIMDDASKEETLLCEQIDMLMNGDYRDDIYDMKLPAGLVQDNSGEQSLREIVDSYTRNDIALILINIANTVFNELGFIPLSRRKNFGTSAGLNKSSPCSEEEQYEKLTWILVSQSGVKDSYYRPAASCIREKGRNQLKVVVKDMFRYNDSSKVYFAASFEPGAPGPPEGALVYPVIEIQRDGPHPKCWARLNGIGHYEDWQQANCLALRLDWQENSKWRSIYYQAFDVMQYEPTNDMGAMRTYAHAMGMIRYLTQRSMSNPKGWYLDAGIARIRELRYDHIYQVVDLLEISPPPQPLKPPATKSRQEVIDDIKKAGGINVYGKFGVVDVQPGQSRDGHMKKRHSCDCCFIVQNNLSTHPRGGIGKARISCVPWKDENGNETNTCVSCRQRGLVCSWTHARGWGLPRTLIAALGMLPRLHVVVNMAPRIILGEQVETGGDEDEDGDVG